MVDLHQGRLDVTQRQGGRESHEPLGEAPHQAGHLIVGAPRQLGGGLRGVHLLQRRDGQHENLRVIAVPVHESETRVEVADGRVKAKDTLVVVAQLGRAHCRGEVTVQMLEIAGRQDVGEGVDFLHRAILATTPHPSSCRRRRARLQRRRELDQHPVRVSHEADALPLWLVGRRG